ncbi:MAG TPA: hypothetical protein VF796_04165, partial [Humisphaera sp.]
MRTILLTILAFGAAAGGFALYLHLQDPVNVTAGNRPQFVPQGASGASNVSLGPGSGLQMTKVDQLNRLASRISCRDYVNVPNSNQIDVTGPVVEFFQYFKTVRNNVPGIRTQRVRIVGTTGRIVLAAMPKGNSQSGFEGGVGGAPRKGTLDDVVIEITPDLLDPAPENPRVSVTIRTPVIHFDNEKYEITSIAYTPRGGAAEVPADQVPVTADGDYEFRGRGLTLQLNDVDGRLELLEIAHGEYLVVRDPAVLEKGGLMGGGTPADAGPTTRPGGVPGNSVVTGEGSMSSDASGPDADPVTVRPLADGAGRPIALAATGKVAAARAAKDGKREPRSKKPPQPPYRATFDQDVRVSQGMMNVVEAQLAAADVMHLEFQPGSKQPATRPTTKPATLPAVRPSDAPAAAGSAADAAGPAVAQAQPDRPKSRPSSRPASRPTTKPAQDPLIVRWTGKLRVVPMDGADGAPALSLPNGESVLRLVGVDKPVRLSRDLGRADCTLADYFSSDGSMQLRGSDKFGQVLVRQLPDPLAPPGTSREATITTDALNYSGAAKLATLHGPSRAVVTL